MIDDLYESIVKLLGNYKQIKNDRDPTKGYYLNKVKNKKHGFIYYVRYLENGKVIPSSWTTNTNDLALAKLYAEENREQLVENYYLKKKNVKIEDMYKVLNEFYKKDSRFMIIAKKLNRNINEKALIFKYNIVNKSFIPFLKKMI